MPRQVAPSPRASHQRAAFIDRYSKIAAAVLLHLDHQTRNCPEAGRALPGRKGWIGIKMRVPVEHKIFECHVAYTYSPDKVVWKEFYYEDVSPA